MSLFLERPRFSVPWFPFPEKLRAQKFEKTLVFAAKLLLAPAYAAKRKAFAIFNPGDLRTLYAQ